MTIDTFNNGEIGGSVRGKLNSTVERVQDYGEPVSDGKGALLVRGSVIYANSLSDLNSIPSGELIDGQSAKTIEGDYYWDEGDGQWKESPIVDIPLRRETGWIRAGGLKSQLDTLAPNQNPFKMCRFEKTSDTRFEIGIPAREPGMMILHRFDRAAASGPTYDFPYRQNLIRPRTYRQRQRFRLSDSNITSNVPITESGNFFRIAEGVGSFIEFTTDALEDLRTRFLHRESGGIVRITINGEDDLANEVPQTGGEALIDTYDESATEVDHDLASGLSVGQRYRVRATVVGQNASATGAQLWVRDAVGFTAEYPYFGQGETYSDSGNDYLAIKQVGSATEYAIGFRPGFDPEASGDFVGSIHGYEELQSINVYADGVEIDIDSVPENEERNYNVISIHQTSLIYHPDYIEQAFAEVFHVHTISRDGLQQSYSWRWLEDVEVRNGYSQMWIFGQSGTGTQDWGRRIKFRGRKWSDYFSGDGEGDDYGNVITDEVLVTGDPELTTPSFGDVSRDIACLVSIGDVDQSFQFFENGLSYTDGVWVNNRVQFRKMYLQPFRNFGQMSEGDLIRGSMSVKYYFSPELCKTLVGAV